MHNKNANIIHSSQSVCNIIFSKNKSCVPFNMTSAVCIGIIWYSVKVLDVTLYHTLHAMIEWTMIIFLSCYAHPPFRMFRKQAIKYKNKVWFMRRSNSKKPIWTRKKWVNDIGTVRLLAMRTWNRDEFCQAYKIG